MTLSTKDTFFGESRHRFVRQLMSDKRQMLRCVSDRFCGQMKAIIIKSSTSTFAVLEEVGYTRCLRLTQWCARCGGWMLENSVELCHFARRLIMYADVSCGIMGVIRTLWFSHPFPVFASWASQHTFRIHWRLSLVPSRAGKCDFKNLGF